MTEREKLDSVLDYLSEGQLELLNDIVDIGRYPDKYRALILGGYDMDSQFDTAYPIGIADHCKEVYPKFYEGLYIFDYSEKTFGELVNVNDLIANRIFKFGSL